MHVNNQAVCEDGNITSLKGATGPRLAMETPASFTQHSPKTSFVFAKDITNFVGLVINGVLDTGILERAAKDLIAQWPVLGGSLITTACTFLPRKPQQLIKSRQIHIQP